MSALDGFLVTWSAAHETFGAGAPSEGAQFDKSAQLQGIGDRVKSAAPGGAWMGSGSDSYAEANNQHAQTIGSVAGLDKRLGVEIDRSAAVVAAGRRDLDVVKKWVVDAAATVPNTAAGQKMLYPVVSKGSGEIADIINRSNGDLIAIADRIRGIGAEYDELGKPKNHDGAEAMDVKGGGDAKGKVPPTALDMNDIVQLGVRDEKGKRILGPPGYKELVPNSGTWVPDPSSPLYQPTPVEAPLDLNDIQQLGVYDEKGKRILGPPGYMELVPNSGTWVPSPNFGGPS